MLVDDGSAFVHLPKAEPSLRSPNPAANINTTYSINVKQHQTYFKIKVKYLRTLLYADWSEKIDLMSSSEKCFLRSFGQRSFAIKHLKR